MTGPGVCLFWRWLPPPSLLMQNHSALLKLERTQQSPRTTCGNSGSDLLCPVSGLEIGSGKPSGVTLASGLWATSVYKVTGVQMACKLYSKFWCE